LWPPPELLHEPPLLPVLELQLLPLLLPPVVPAIMAMRPQLEHVESAVTSKA